MNFPAESSEETSESSQGMGPRTRQSVDSTSQISSALRDAGCNLSGSPGSGIWDKLLSAPRAAQSAAGSDLRQSVSMVGLSDRHPLPRTSIDISHCPAVVLARLICLPESMQWKAAAIRQAIQIQVRKSWIFSKVHY